MCELRACCVDGSHTKRQFTQVVTVTGDSDQPQPPAMLIHRGKGCLTETSLAELIDSGENIIHAWDDWVFGIALLSFMALQVNVSFEKIVSGV